MTVKDVKAAVAEIVEKSEVAAPDHEMLHGMEDNLYLGVLDAIATGHHKGSARKLAKAALKSQKVDRVRWYS